MCRQDLGIVHRQVHAALLQIISRRDVGTIFSLQLPGVAPIFRVHCGGNLDRCIFAACWIERDELVFRRPVPWEVGEKIIVEHLVCPVGDDVVFDWNSCSVTIYEELAAHIRSGAEAVSFASRFSTYTRESVALQRVAEPGAGAREERAGDGRGGGPLPEGLSELQRLILEMRKAMRGDILADGMQEPDQDEAAIVALEVAMGRKLGRLRMGRKRRKSALRKGRFVNKKRGAAQGRPGQAAGGGAEAGGGQGGGAGPAAGDRGGQAAGGAAEPGAGRRRGGGQICTQRGARQRLDLPGSFADLPHSNGLSLACRTCGKSRNLASGTTAKLSEAQMVARLLAWEAACSGGDGVGQPHASGAPLLADFAWADPS